MDVVDDDALPIQDRPPAGELAGEGKLQAHQPLHLLARVRGIVETGAFQPFDHGIAGLAQPHRALSDGVEHALEVGRRRGDDPQHVAEGRLLLQRRRDAAVALLELLEQAGVLDGNDRLVSERLQ